MVCARLGIGQGTGRNIAARGGSVRRVRGLSDKGFCPDIFAREIRVRICLDFFASDFVWTAAFRPLSLSFHSLLFLLDKA
jgi:hypothetical protein